MDGKADDDGWLTLTARAAIQSTVVSLTQDIESHYMEAYLTCTK